VYRDQALAPGAMKAMLDWYRANPFREVLRGPWPQLDTPTLLVWGVRDSALGQSMTERTGELVRELELRFLEASHWVQQDAPDEVNAILREWLAR
jgi:pimeloyl-ACP methyl ester carboxylesterase